VTQAIHAAGSARAPKGAVTNRNGGGIDEGVPAGEARAGLDLLLPAEVVGRLRHAGEHRPGRAPEGEEVAPLRPLRSPPRDRQQRQAGDAEQDRIAAHPGSVQPVGLANE
jgi:hypothetical protein